MGPTVDGGNHLGGGEGGSIGPTLGSGDVGIGGRSGLLLSGTGDLLMAYPWVGRYLVVGAEPRHA